ncbi:DUF735 family protein, partial [Borrelia hispanica]
MTSIPTIPTVFHDTEVEKIIHAELEFIDQIIKEVKTLNDNFTDINATTNLNSRFIAFW